MGDYRIVKAQLPVLGFGGHNLLVLLDPDGNVVAELDGDGRGRQFQADRLFAVVNEYSGGQGGFYRPDLAQTTIASGDKTIMNFWNAAKAAQDQINLLSLHYPFLGFGDNSNSVARTLIAAMGLNDAPIPGFPRVTPGDETILLEPEAIRNIQRQYNIKAPRSEVAPDAVQSEQTAANDGSPNAPGDNLQTRASNDTPLLRVSNAIGVTSGEETAPPGSLPTNPTPPGVAANTTNNDVPVRRLVGRVVNLSTPPASDSAPDLIGDPQAAFDGRFGSLATSPAGTALDDNGKPASKPVLGLFSGKPMRFMSDLRYAVSLRRGRGSKSPERPGRPVAGLRETAAIAI
jgi:hypothetical protein